MAKGDGEGGKSDRDGKKGDGVKEGDAEGGKSDGDVDGRVTKRTRASKRAANHFILNWNKMFDLVT